MSNQARPALLNARRVVVKLGTGALTRSQGTFEREHFQALASDLLWASHGRELVVVSSGAIALGIERLGWPARPKDIPGKQACAAVGQSRLMQAYEEAFGPSGKRVAQVLLTHEDVQQRRRYLNAKQTFARLLEAGVVPVVNENDTVAVEEIRFGDNDTLSSLVASLVEADLLVLLSDVEGVYDADPRRSPSARLLSRVDQLTPELVASAGGASTAHGTGGMTTKLRAAARAAEVGIHCVIASGHAPGRLREVLSGQETGTWFPPTTTRRQARAAWIAHALKPQGLLLIDDGARRALLDAKKSLLPSGIREVRGSFERGDPVDIAGPDGAPFARGLASYPSEDLRKLAGRQSADIEALLGYRHGDEAVHRDHLSELGTA